MKPTTVAPTRREQWHVFLPAGVAMALSLAGDLTLYAVLPAYSTSLGLSLATLGVLLSANRLIRLASNPLVGLLADRFSRRRFVLTGLTTGVISTCLYVAAHGFWLFLLGRILWGISWSILYIGIYCMMTDVTDAQDRGWGSGMLQTFYFFGLAFNPVIGGFLSDQMGVTTAMIACAGIQGIGWLGAVWFLPETRPVVKRSPAVPLALNIHFAAARQKVSGWVGSVSREWFARNRETLSANYLYLLTLFIGDGIIMSTITMYLKQRYGHGVPLGQLALPAASVGGVLIALRAVISAGAAPLAGRWSDRSGARWGVAGWGALIAIAGCGLLGLGSHFWVIILGIILASFGSGMLMAVIPAIVSSASGKQSSLAIGFLTTSGDVGCAVAPLMSYTLFSSLALSQLYLISAGLLVTGLLLALTMTRRKAPAFTLAENPGTETYK